MSMERARSTLDAIQDAIKSAYTGTFIVGLKSRKRKAFVIESVSPNALRYSKFAYHHLRTCISTCARWDAEAKVFKAIIDDAKSVIQWQKPNVPFSINASGQLRLASAFHPGALYNRIPRKSLNTCDLATVCLPASLLQTLTISKWYCISF